MNVLGMDWITGFALGVEFPDKATPEEYEEDGPMPWVVVHLGILRIFVTKYEIED